jgi:farnesyl-diphosphate farnesyltransferase
MRICCAASPTPSKTSRHAVGRAKARHENAFVDAVTGRRSTALRHTELRRCFQMQTLEAERDLMRRLPLVLQVTRSLNPVQQASIVNCLKVMSHGMHDFQRKVGIQGLETLHDMDRYCYCVAGVVGEMLTEMFIDFEPALAPHRDTMMRLAVSFGQGLQMTNILKDQWEDRSHGACWLPQDVFAKRHGVNLVELQSGAAERRLRRHVERTHRRGARASARALDYTLLIPAKHAGVRRFCLWSVGMALLTLRNLHNNLDFSRRAADQGLAQRCGRTIVLTKHGQQIQFELALDVSMAARQLPLDAAG